MKTREIYANAVAQTWGQLPPKAQAGLTEWLIATHQPHMEVEA